MIPGLLHGKCISGGKCTKFCTSFKRVVDSTYDKCGWCLHDICEHTIIGVIDSLGVPTLSMSPEAPQLPLTIPVTTVRGRNQTFTRAGIKDPHSAGIFVQNKNLVTQSFFMNI